jgi:aspartate-semialdehyde dehydrogenase
MVFMDRESRPRTGDFLNICRKKDTTEMSKQYVVAVVGATGAVGSEMIKYLEARQFPVKQLKPLSSARSAGQTIQFHGEVVTVEEATPGSFRGVDIALFSAGGGVSKQLAPAAVDHGVVVIDNSNAFRMADTVPLVVPEVNADAVTTHKGIIANPNCSTIQMVVALKPLYDRYGIDRVIVSTYQSVSGSGQQAMDELVEQAHAVLHGQPVRKEIMPVKSLDRHYQMAFNIVPQIDVADESGFTLEEMKMVRETQKIFADETIGVTATCVRVPVLRGHSEAVYVELKEDYQLEEVKQLLAQQAGLVVQDDISAQQYPMPLDAAERTEVFVGRIRPDLTHPRALNMWVVSDNLLKGAATNAIQIAEALIAAEAPVASE